MNPLTRLTVLAVAAVLVVGAAVLALRPALNLASAPSSSANSGSNAHSTATPLPTDGVLVPPNPLPDPSGAPLPGDLIDRTYEVNPPEDLDGRQLLLKLRAADDPHCTAMYGGRSTCFTVLWNPVKSGADPGARGPARIQDGKLVLGFALVPFDQACIGSTATYAYEDAGQTLRGIDTPACTFPGFRQLNATVCASVPTVLDTRLKADAFALPMRLTIPAGWKPLNGIGGALGFVESGCPERPDSTWWGPDVLLVDEAQIHDASDVVSTVPAKADRSRFVAWPDDFFEYITSLPGVTVVSGPEPTTIGGVTGTQVVVMAPAMHPLVWMKGDSSWLGGGGTGVEPPFERRFIIVKTGGHTLFISFFDDPSRFDARDAQVRAILDSITFG